jgi:hypothetical protein
VGAIVLSISWSDKRQAGHHGGDELYKLKGVPGIWHEQCLEEAR